MLAGLRGPAGESGAASARLSFRSWHVCPGNPATTPRREPAATRAGHSQAAPAGSSVDQQAGESGAPGNSAFGARFRPLLPTGRETPSPLWAAPHCLFVNRIGVQVSSFSFQLVYDGAVGTRVTAPSFPLVLGSA